jgi:hypothetical protein
MGGEPRLERQHATQRLLAVLLRRCGGAVRLTEEEVAYWRDPDAFPVVEVVTPVVMRGSAGVMVPSPTGEVWVQLSEPGVAKVLPVRAEPQSERLTRLMEEARRAE